MHAYNCTCMQKCAISDSGGRCRRVFGLGTRLSGPYTCSNPPGALARAPSVYPFIVFPIPFHHVEHSDQADSSFSSLFSPCILAHRRAHTRRPALETTPSPQRITRTQHAQPPSPRNTLALSFTLRTHSFPPSHPPRPPPTRLLSSRSLLTNTFLQPHESANPPHKASPSPNSNAQAGNAPRFPALPPSGDYLPFHARRFVVPTSTLRPTLTTTPKHQTAHRQKYPPFRA